MREPHAGSLRHRVKIVLWQDQSAGFDQVETVDGQPFYRWAEIAAVSPATFWGSQQIDTGVTHLIGLRYCDIITSRHAVELAGQRYRVRRIKHNTGARRWTWLECELLGVI